MRVLPFTEALALSAILVSSAFMQCSLADVKIDSSLDSQTLTLVHKVIRPKSRSAWLSEVLPKYIADQSPPADWFNAGQGGGLWTVSTSRFDLSQATYDILTVKAWSDSEAPLFAANPKATAVWWSESTPQHVKAWSDWIALDTNQKKPNRFTARATEALLDADWPSHSAFYEENRIIGVVAEDRYPVIVNGSLLEESVLLVPQAVNPSGTSLRIYHRAGDPACLPILKKHLNVRK